MTAAWLRVDGLLPPKVLKKEISGGGALMLFFPSPCPRDVLERRVLARGSAPVLGAWE